MLLPGPFFCLANAVAVKPEAPAGGNRRCHAENWSQPLAGLALKLRVEVERPRDLRQESER